MANLYGYADRHVSKKWGTVRTVGDILDEAQAPVSVLRYGAKGDGVTNDTSAIQAAIDAMNARGGGAVHFPEGTYLTGSLTWRQRVSLYGPLRGFPGRSLDAPVKLKAVSGTTGYLLDSEDDGTGTLGHYMTAMGLCLAGLGAGTSLGGIRLRDSVRQSVVSCSFDSFADQAIYGDGTAGAPLIENCFAQNCLLNRTRTGLNGVLEIDGSDSTIRGGEFTASCANGALSRTAITGTAQAGSSSTITLASGASSVDNDYAGWLVEITSGTGSGGANIISSYVGSTKVATMVSNWVTAPDNTSVYRVSSLQCSAIVIRGSAGYLGSGLVAEISDAGVVILSSGTPTRFSGVRCDLNSGHGLVIAGGVTGGILMSSRNGQAGDNSYDGVIVLPGSFGDLRVNSGSLGTDSYAGNNYQQRYGVKCADGGGNATKCRLSGTGQNNQTGLVSMFQATTGSSFKIEDSAEGLFTTGTTPFIDGYCRVALTYGSTTSITAFTGLVPNNIYYIKATNSNITLVNSANIVTTAGSDLAMVSGRTYMFTCPSNGILRQIGT